MTHDLMDILILDFNKISIQLKVWITEVFPSLSSDLLSKRTLLAALLPPLLIFPAMTMLLSESLCNLKMYRSPSFYKQWLPPNIHHYCGNHIYVIVGRLLQLMFLLINTFSLCYVFVNKVLKALKRMLQVHIHFKIG